MIQNTSYQILPFLDSLKATRLDIVFKPTVHAEQKAWLGAAVRNRFLFACESVKTNDGVSLREAFNVCPLDKSHFLYKQYADGFPKCFVWNVAGAHPRTKGFAFKDSKEYTMSLFVFGFASQWIDEIKLAIRRMMLMGLGSNPAPLELVDIIVHEPFSLENFAKHIHTKPVLLTIQTQTPLSLLKYREESSDGFQKKMNGFPAFYQIVRTCVSRLATLNLLYAENNDIWSTFDSQEKWSLSIDGLSNAASSAWLQSAEIKNVVAYGTPKQNTDTVYRFSGYVGELTFSNVDALLVPIVNMMGTLGIGNDVSYGLGFYNVNIRQYGNK